MILRSFSSYISLWGLLFSASTLALTLKLDKREIFREEKSGVLYKKSRGLLPKGTVIKIDDEFVKRYYRGDKKNESDLMKWLKNIHHNVNLSKFQSRGKRVKRDYFAPIEILSIPGKNPPFKVGEKGQIAIRYLAKKKGLSFVTKKAAPLYQEFSKKVEITKRIKKTKKVIEDCINCTTSGKKESIVLDDLEKNVGGVVDKISPLKPQAKAKDNYPFENPILGALKVFKAQYGSCEALKLEKLQKFLPKWKWGGTMSLKERPLSLECSDRVDCSGFVSAAFLASGLRVKPNKRSGKRYRTNTSGIESSLASSRSCFQMVKGPSLKDLIRPGDIVNKSNNHVIMIDRIGKDPLGVEKIYNNYRKSGNKENALKQCFYISKKSMNLDIIHSSSTRKGSGIHRMPLSELWGSVAMTMVYYAREACLHFIENSADTPFNPSGSKKLGRVLRHKGVKEPACVLDKKPKVTRKGESYEC